MTITPTARGILWMILMSINFTLMLVFIRGLADDITVPQIVFLRSVVGLAIFLPILLRGGLAGFKPARPGLLAIRGVLLMGGMLTLFSAIAVMPFTDAIALHFTIPIFTVILAVIVLREQVSWHLWLAVLFGFAGALAIIRPGAGTIAPAALIVLLSAMFYASDNIAVKLLGQSEPPSRIVFYMHAGSLVMALAIALFDWRRLAWHMVPEILAVGIFASFAHFCLTRAYFFAKASTVTPFSFIRLPVSAALAWFLFNEPTDIWTWAGAVAIFAATSYIAKREGALGGGAKKPQPE